MSNSDIVRNCHSDIQLHMSGVCFSQLHELLSFSVKFSRMVEGTLSVEYLRACHFLSLFNSISSDYEHFHSDENPIIKFLSSYYPD